MCRILSYLGTPVLLDHLLYAPDSSLLNQTIHARMLAMLEKAHGCSGPLVSVLARASLSKARDPATAQLVYLARKANRDLGKAVYLPDFSCSPRS